MKDAFHKRLKNIGEKVAKGAVMGGVMGRAVKGLAKMNIGVSAKKKGIMRGEMKGALGRVVKGVKMGAKLGGLKKLPRKMK